MNDEPTGVQFHDWDADEWREEEAARAQRAIELERVRTKSIAKTTPPTRPPGKDSATTFVKGPAEVHT